MVQDARRQDRLRLFALGEPLQRYARNLEPDGNAAFRLVHNALSAALDEAPDPRRMTLLRQHVDHGFAASKAGAPGDKP